MHIAFITPEYPIKKFKGSVGGIGTFTKNLAEELVNHQQKVTVFVHSAMENDVVIENGVEIHFVALKKVKAITWLVNRWHFQQYVQKVISKNNIDVIEAPEWTGFTAFMKFSCPLVIRLHGSDTYFCHLEGRLVKKKNYFFEKKALYTADAIVGVSHFVAAKTKELFSLKKEIKVIHNAIHTQLFVPNHQHIQPKTILYFGTIVRKKGVLALARAFNKLINLDDEITLTLLGKDNIDVQTGKSTLSLITNSLCKKAQRNLIHLPEVPATQVIPIIQQAELVILPSFGEAFPMAWLEAMALEKYIITSNIGWSVELMENNVTGYTVSPCNIDDFVHKIMLQLEDTPHRKKMAKAARQKIVQNFEMSQKVKENMNFYQSLLS